MKIIYKAPGEEAEVRDVPNSPAALCALVGCGIDVKPVAEDAAIVCRSDMWYDKSPANGRFLGRWWFGPILLVGIDGCEFCDFSGDEEQWKGVLKDE